MDGLAVESDVEVDGAVHPPWDGNVVESNDNGSLTGPKALHLETPWVASSETGKREQQDNDLQELHLFFIFQLDCMLRNYPVDFEFFLH